jgi:hypothetical protein
MNSAVRRAVMLAHNDVVAKTNAVACTNAALVMNDGILGDEVEAVATHQV